MTLEDTYTSVPSMSEIPSTSRLDVDALFVPLPRTASSTYTGRSNGDLSRSGSATSHSANISGAGGASIHTPRSQTTTFGGHKAPGEGPSTAHTSFTSQFIPHTATSGSHVPGVQPNAAFFHPSRPSYYSTNHSAYGDFNYGPNPVSGFSVLPAHMMAPSSAAAPPPTQQRPASTGSDSIAHGSFTTEEFGGSGSGKHGTVTSSNMDTAGRSFSTKTSRMPLLPIGQRPKLAASESNGSGGSRPRSNTLQQTRKHNGGGSIATPTGGRVRTSLEKFLRRTLSVDAHSPTMTFTRSKELSSLEDLEASGGEFSDTYVELKEHRARNGSTFNVAMENGPLSPSTLSRRKQYSDVHSSHTPGQRSRFPQFNPIPPDDPAALLVEKTPMVSDLGKPKRNYQLYPSRNSFPLGGRILTGGDSVWPFAGSFILVIGVVGTWSATTAVWWWENETPAVPIVGAYLSLLAISNMLATVSHYKY